MGGRESTDWILKKTTDALPCHINLPYACEPWILTAELKKITQAMEKYCYCRILPISCKNHVSCYQWQSPWQDPAGNLTTWRPPDHRNCSGMVMSPVHKVWPKPSSKAQRKGEEDKADRGRGRKTTSGNGQAWRSTSSRGHWRTGKDGGNWLWKSPVVHQRPSQLRDR